MRLLSRERRQTFKHLSSTFGFAAGISAAFQVMRNKPLIRSRIKSIRTPIYWRRHNSDLQTLYQIFGRLEADVDLGFAPKTIIDAGANIGLTSLFFANKYPDAKILAVEPEAENCKTFRMNCAEYPQIKLIESALWSSNCRLAIENPQADSWAFRFGDGDHVSGAAQTIPAITPQSLIEMSGFEQVDLFKIDIEGAEKEVFEADYTAWLAKVRCLLVETHESVKPGSESAVNSAIATRPHKSQLHGEYLFVQF